MNDIETLKDIEAIKQLKARYCRFLDAKDWTAWRGIFTDDFVSDTTGAGGQLIVSADDFITLVKKFLGKPKQVTAHHVHAPEIELTSATTAKGIWALEDFVRFGFGINLRGYGHYHETYEKVDGRWLIKSSTLTRLREDLVTPFFSFYISNLLRKARK